MAPKYKLSCMSHATLYSCTYAASLSLSRCVIVSLSIVMSDVCSSVSHNVTLSEAIRIEVECHVTTDSRSSLNKLSSERA